MVVRFGPGALEPNFSTNQWDKAVFAVAVDAFRAAEIQTGAAKWYDYFIASATSPMNNEDKNLLINQVQTDVSLISFLSVISVFFLGSLLSKFGSYDLSVKIPISFLIISTFAFLFSALILSNSSQRIIEGNSERTQQYLMYGYAISEYMGVFLFVLSIPLTVSVITEDLYLRAITFFSVILGMGLYQLMGFSLLENHFSSRYRLISVITILFGVALFAAQVYAFHFTAVAVVFLAFIFLITALAPMELFK